ncbi:MAG: hypothetical protein RLZZ58_1542 [Pseudomonadota bacterium]
MAPPVLIIRPQPGADATAAAARRLGLVPLVMSLFTEISVAWGVPDPAHYDAMMLTSARAVRLAGPGLARLSALPVCAVGAATAAAARAAGLNVTIIGGGDAAALIDQAVRAGLRRLLWPCGRHRRALSPPPGMTIDPLPVYAATALAAPPDWDGQLAQLPVVLLHSARAAAHFASLAGDQRSALTLVAISAAAARAAGPGWRRLAVADRARDGAMLALAAKLCQDADMDAASQDLA